MGGGLPCVVLRAGGYPSNLHDTALTMGDDPLIGSKPLATDTPGYKLDTGKLRYDLIPSDFLEGITYILTWACTRKDPPPYPERNWEKGMKWSKVFAALMRHMWAWWKREPCDKESGKSHLWHAGACIAFLITYERTHPELDDRP